METHFLKLWDGLCFCVGTPEKEKGNTTTIPQKSAKKRSDWFSLLRKKNPTSLFSMFAFCELLDYRKLEHLTDKQYWDLVPTEFPYEDWDEWLRVFEERETDSSYLMRSLSIVEVPAVGCWKPHRGFEI